MANSFHAQDWRPSRPRVMRLASRAVEPLILLALFGLIALWITGAPVHSLLPIQPPA